MTKTAPHGSGFPWGLLVQAIVLVLSFIEEVVKEAKKS
jgi:hypothetical protein